MDKPTLVGVFQIIPYITLRIKLDFENGWWRFLLEYFDKFVDNTLFVI